MLIQAKLVVAAHSYLALIVISIIAFTLAFTGPSAMELAVAVATFIVIIVSTNGYRQRERWGYIALFTADIFLVGVAIAFMRSPGYVALGDLFALALFSALVPAFVMLSLSKTRAWVAAEES